MNFCLFRSQDSLFCLFILFSKRMKCLPVIKNSVLPSVSWGATYSLILLVLHNFDDDLTIVLWNFPLTKMLWDFEYNKISVLLTILEKNVLLRELFSWKCLFSYQVLTWVLTHLQTCLWNITSSYNSKQKCLCNKATMWFKNKEIFVNYMSPECLQKQF